MLCVREKIALKAEGNFLNLRAEMNEVLHLVIACSNQYRRLHLL